MLGRKPKTIGVDPQTKGFSFAILEGEEALIDWGSIHLNDKKSDHELLLRLGTLLDRYEPSLMVLEDLRGSPRGPRARRRVKRIREEAQRRGIAVRAASWSTVRSLFAPALPTTYEVCLGVAKWFPELAPRLPRPRRPWETEDERVHLFRAAALALSLLREETKNW